MKERGSLFLILTTCLSVLWGEDGTWSYETVPATVQATNFAGFPDYNLNTALGADRYTYYSTPITGQNSVTTNLEAGHIWSGHESLTHVNSFSHNAGAFGETTADLYDRHATWAGMLIGGRQTAGGGIYQQGIAPGTDLRSAALATAWSGEAYALSFGFSYTTVATAYNTAFTTSDVINSSYGYADSAGINAFTLLSDAAAFAHSTATHVVSAGNSGSSANTLGAPGAGYNTIAVGALAPQDNYNVVAEFSSRAPQDFGYIDDQGNAVTVAGVRAAVDLAAPGQDLVSAYYDGQTGGNNPTLAGSTAGTGADNQYSVISGTSFAAPLVAGGAALITSAANTLPELSGNADATQSVVVKSLLLSGADKTSGWDNGQALTNLNGDNILVTTQSLDWTTGAGRLNLDRSFEIQLTGQTDVAGFGQGALGSVDSTGWDYGAARIGIHNDYILQGTQEANSSMISTLAWLRNREWDQVNILVADLAQADLNLSIWLLDDHLNFSTPVARSESLYNTVEHLAFTLPETGRYGIRVEYSSNTFDNTFGDVWGSAEQEQTYGLSWQVVAIPEARPWIFLVSLSMAVIVTRGKCR